MYAVELLERAERVVVALCRQDLARLTSPGAERVCRVATAQHSREVPKRFGDGADLVTHRQVGVVGNGPRAGAAAERFGIREGRNQNRPARTDRIQERGAQCGGTALDPPEAGQ